MQSEREIVRAILKQNEFLLRRHLVLSATVLDHMKENGLLTDITRRKILGSAPHRQVGMLLETLSCMSLQSFRKFLDTLRKTGHRWIADMLLDTDVTYNGQKEISRFGMGTRAADVSPTRFTRFSQPADDRKSITAGGMASATDNSAFSLASLLKAREDANISTSGTRGMINPRALFTDPLTGGTQSIPALPGIHTHGRQMVYPQTQEAIPLTLMGLNEAFSNQEQTNQQTLAVLRQEEVAIRQLMEQNARDQGRVQHKQEVVSDIVHHLKGIHYRARELADQAPNPNIGRYRLAQLNQIPWSTNH